MTDVIFGAANGVSFFVVSRLISSTVILPVTAEESGDYEKNNVGGNSTVTLRNKFNASLMEPVKKKSDSTTLFSKENNVHGNEEVKEANRKYSVDYRKLKRFDVITVSGREKLITPLKEDSMILALT